MVNFGTNTSNSSSVADRRLLVWTALNIFATSLIAVDLVWSSEWKWSIHSSMAQLFSSCKVSPVSLSYSSAIFFLNLYRLLNRIPYWSDFKSACSIVCSTKWLRFSCRKSLSGSSLVTTLSRVKPLVCRYCCIRSTSSSTAAQKYR